MNIDITAKKIMSWLMGTWLSGIVLLFLVFLTKLLIEGVFK